jgi:hypothetical protein
MTDSMPDDTGTNHKFHNAGSLQARTRWGTTPSGVRGESGQAVQVGHALTATRSLPALAMAHSCRMSLLLNLNSRAWASGDETMPDFHRRQVNKNK